LVRSNRNRRRATTFQSLLAALLATATLSGPAGAVDFFVINGNDSGPGSLRQAIFDSNTAGGSNTITIDNNVVSTITLTKSLPMITASVTITGNNTTLDANNAGRAFFVQSGTVAISNLTINNAVAQGGAGGTSPGGGGGGGLGAGAAVFVNTGAAASLTNVTVGNASATGGAGGNGGVGSQAGAGGGGLGGAGGTSAANGGGGGGGYAGAGGNAITAGSAGGGGEFGTGGTSSGFGGGGGGGQQGTGGNGAVSGGGGGGGATTSGNNASGGTGGTGGAPQGGDGGSTNGAGGAGAALGGGGGSGSTAVGPGGTGGLSGGGGGGGANTAGGAGGIGGGGGGGSGRVGGAGGDYGGGGGSSAGSTGGAGGFGGGGGGGSTGPNPGTGGVGGFGGGGGGGNTGAAGGTLGGSGASAGVGAGGGGGGAAGGAFFVRSGGTLTINDIDLAGTYNVTGGAGGSGATAGSAQGQVAYVQGTGTTTFNISSGTQSFGSADALAGSGSLGKSGAGTLALTGNNANYTGVTTVTGGLINFNAINSFGSGQINLNGGGLQWAIGTATDISSKLATLGAGGGTLDTNGNNVSFANGLGGTGGITKAGTGTLTLAGANTYTGTTTISGGTLQIGNGGTTGTLGSGIVVNNANLTFNRSNTVTVANAISGTGSLTQAGSGTLILTGSNSYTGGTSVGAGTLQIGVNGGAQGKVVGAVSVTGGATLNVNNADTSGITGITVGNTSTVNFNNSSSAGSATITNGFIVNFNNSSTAGTANITNNVQLNFKNTSSAGSATIVNNNALLFTNNATLGSASLTNSSGATTTFSNATSLGSGTVTNAGTLAIQGSANAGTATVTTQNGGMTQLRNGGSGAAARFITEAGGQLDISASTGGTSLGSIEGAGDVKLGSKTLTVGGTNLSTMVSGVVSDGGVTPGTGGGLTKIGTGTLTLSGNNTYTGSTTVSAGTLQVGNGGTTGTLGSGNVVNNAALVFNRSDSITVANDISGTGSLTQNGSGTLILTGTNTYSGATTINAGILRGGSANAFSGNSAFTVNAGGTLDLNGFDQAVGSISGTGSLINSGSSVSALSIGSDGSSSTLSLSVLDGPGAAIALTKDGAGTLTLAGNNSYSGATTVTDGTLLAGSANAFSRNSAFTLGSSGVIDLNGMNQTIGSLSGDGLVTNSGINAPATLTTNGDNSSTTFSGTIQDGTSATGLTKDGTGILILSGSSTYSGATTILAGTLLIDNGTALSETTDITVAAGAALTISDNTFGLAAANSLSGAGTVNLSPDPAVGFGGLTLLGDVSTTFSGTFAGNGDLTLMNGNHLTLTGTGGSSGTIGGDLELCSCGPTGGLTIDGTSLTVIGRFMGVNVDGGTLTVTNGGTLTIGPTLDIGSDLTVSGAVIITGAGSTVTVNGRTGIGIFDAGTLTISNGGRLNSREGAEIDQIFSGTPSATVTGAGSTWAVTGTLRVGTGTLPGGPGSLSVLNGGTVTATDVRIGDEVDFSSLVTVSGAGSSLQIADGLRIGSADGTFRGTLTVADGGSVTAGDARIGIGSTLNLGTGGLAGSITTATILNEGAIVANFTDTSTLSASISGTGTLTKQGTGTLTLTGTNTYSGITTISGGTLQVGNGGTSGTLGSGAVVNNATLAFNRADDIAVANDISGSGALTKTGAGVLTLTGTNTYTGNTTVNLGTLSIDSDARLGNGGTLILAGGALNTTADINTARHVTIGSGDGFVRPDAGTTLTLGGAVDGSGKLVMAGPGTLVLTGAKSYGGGTGLVDGTTIIDNGGSLGTGQLSFEGGSLRSTATLTLGNAIDIVDGVTANVHAATGTTLTLAPSAMTAGDDATLAFGNASNTGTVVLSLPAGSPGFFNGQVAVIAGTLRAGNANFGNLTSGAASTTIAAGATLDLDGFSAAIGNLIGTGTLAPGSNAAQVTTVGQGAFGGSITGAGGLTKNGLGTLILSGANSYTGGTVIDGGTLRLDTGGGLAATGALTINLGTFDLNGQTQTVGALTGSILSAITLGSGTLTTDSSTTTTFAGGISGTGSLVKAGTGTLILSGLNTYSGGTTVSGGTLQGNTLSLQGNITNNATVAFVQNTGGAYAGVISGSGNVTVDAGSQTVAFTGDNTYSGTTTIVAGTLQVGQGGTTGSLGSGNVVNNGRLAFARSDAITVGNVISGSGALVQGGSGTLTLTGANTYTGTTTIGLLGTIAVSADNNLGNGGALNLEGGTLKFLSNFDLDSGRAVRVSVLGTIDTNGFDTTIGQTIADGDAAGLLVKTGAGTLTLAGTNTFSNGLVIAGGTVSVSADDRLGAAGGTLVLDGGTLQTVASFTSSRATTINAAGGTFRVGAGTTLDWTGPIGGSGALSKTGTGALVLGGNNGFGGLLLGLGTVSVGADQNLGLAGAGLAMESGTTLQMTGSFTTAREISVGGFGSVALQVESGSTVTWNGAIGGLAALAKTGSGTLVLGGNNSFLGASVTGGILQVAADINLGIGALTLDGGALRTTASFTATRDATMGTGGGMFDVDSGTTLTWNGAIGGPGALLKAGDGTLVLGGTSLYSGGTTVSAGTLQGNTSSLQGNIINNATVVFVQATDGIYAGQISGSGGLIKQGTGTLTFAGSNSYSGATTVSSGTLKAGGVAAFSSSSAFTVSSGGTLDLAGGSQTIGSLAGAGTVTNSGPAEATLTAGGNNATTVFSGTIEDGAAAMGLTKAGSGVLTLSGSNSYTGATTLAGGVLAVSADNNLGNGGALTFNGSTLKLLQAFNLAAGRAISLAGNGTIDTGVFDTTIGQPMSGPGALTKLGTGTLTLNGANTYAGLTTVSAGALALNGSVAGSVLVQNGGVFGGVGMVGGNLTVQGTVTPGNSIGTLTIGGNYTSAAGSVYIAEVNAAGQGDQIRAASATLQGGTVQVQPQAGTYRRTTTYALVSTTGATTGTYAGVTSTQASLVPTLVYGANGVTLSLLNLDATFSNPGFTPNQNAVANVLTQASPTATGDFANVLNVLSNLDPAALGKILDTIGGQIYSGFGTVGVQTLLTFMENFQFQAGGGQTNTASAQGRSTYTELAEACDVACDTTSPARWHAWGGGVGAFGTVAGDTNARGLTYSLGGFAAGLDRSFGNGLKAGVATGFSAASLYPQGASGNGTSNTLQFALYGGYAEGPVYLDLLAGYAHADNRMTRPIVIPGLPYRAAQGYTTANQFFGQIEAGYRVDVAPRFGGFITPFARLQASTSTQNGFTETGADSMNLTVAQQTTQSLRTVFGAQLGAAIDAGWHGPLNVVFRAGWSHEFADLTRPVTAAFAGAPALTFTTQGATAPRDGVVLGFGLNTAISESTRLYFRYDGDLTGGNTNHALSAGIRFTW
jgi:autotransporter-associated beta strand protein